MLGPILLLLSTQVTAPPATPGVDQEILVIGRKLARWEARYAVRGDQLGCKTKRSTGDSEIDAIGCASFEHCVGQLRGRIRESDRADPEKAARKTMKSAIKRDLAGCVSVQRDQRIADLADRRFLARHRGGV